MVGEGAEEKDVKPLSATLARSGRLEFRNFRVVAMATNHRQAVAQPPVTRLFATTVKSFLWWLVTDEWVSSQQPGGALDQNERLRGRL